MAPSRRQGTARRRKSAQESEPRGKQPFRARGADNAGDESPRWATSGDGEPGAEAGDGAGFWGRQRGKAPSRSKVPVIETAIRRASRAFPCAPGSVTTCCALVNTRERLCGSHVIAHAMKPTPAILNARSALCALSIVEHPLSDDVPPARHAPHRTVTSWAEVYHCVGVWSIGSALPDLSQTGRGVATHAEAI